MLSPALSAVITIARASSRVLFLAAVPTLVVTTLILAMIYDADFYLRGQLQQQVHQTSGFGVEELAAVNEGLVQFFRDRESLSTTLTRAGASPTVFNYKETIHLEDVREIVFRLAWWQVVTGLYSLSFLGVVAASAGRRASSRVGRWLLRGSLATLGFVALAGVLSVLDFGTLFLQFHLISFQNDYWLLDPRTDNLIRMFPFYFWYQAAVTLVLQTGLTAVAMGIVGALLIGIGRRTT